MRPDNEAGSGNWLLAAAAVLLLPLAIFALGFFDDDGVDTIDEPTVTAEDEPLAAAGSSDGPQAPGTDATPTAEPIPSPTALPTATPEPTPTPEPTATPEPTPTPEPTATPEPTSTPEPAGGLVVRSDPDTAFVGDTPQDVLLALGEASIGGVPDSQAVIRNGQIFLFGSVPDADSARSIVDLAAQILGADNVFDFYTIDARAASASDGDIRVDDTILFETNSAVIAPEFEPLLNQAIALMSIRPDVEMRVVGHTDAVGRASDNQVLSEERAGAVVEYLVRRGIDRGRLEAVGRGERQPVAPNDTEAGRELNRRIQVFLTNVLG